MPIYLDNNPQYLYSYKLASSVTETEGADRFHELGRANYLLSLKYFHSGATISA